MLTIALLRHSITAGNLARQYIGSIDQPLAPEGVSLARECAPLMPGVERVYTSPMRRCRQTAALLFPQHPARVADDLRECDFGACEGKTHDELSEHSFYRSWLQAAGALPPPGGECGESFVRRCVEGFYRMVDELRADGIESAAAVIHGGSIMAVMSRLALPERGFYDWQTENCSGFLVAVESGAHRLKVLRELCCPTCPAPVGW
jgi:alpha-ribazole phosphatase